MRYSRVLALFVVRETMGHLEPFANAHPLHNHMVPDDSTLILSAVM